MASEYVNPVLPGFRPDPSVVRVGTDYYMVNSTFHYFPGIVISRSTDLVHWTDIGHVFTRSEWLDLSILPDSRGFWAPDISWHDGLYYIFVTLRLNELKSDGTPADLVRRQMIVTAEKPEGPWSRPRFIDINGIDPSHFVDDDGSHYMVLNPGATLVPLDRECTKAIGKPVKIWEGSGGRAPEGPHIFRKEGWYHIVMAEGGTGFGHQIATGRSRNLYGPYESNPHNPLLKQTDPSAELQRTGHGKFVMTPDGDWWTLYLCGRPLLFSRSGMEDDRFCVLGRETALAHVEWTDEQWPVINGGKGPLLKGQVPDLPSDSRIIPELDDFDGPELGLQWYTPRNPDYSAFSLTENPGHLRIYTRDGDLDTLSAKPFLRRQEHFSGSASCRMIFLPGDEYIEAGLTAYYDTKTHMKFCRVRANGRLWIRLSENRGYGYRTLAETPDSEQDKGVIYLEMRFRDLERTFLWSWDGENWIELDTVRDCWFLSDEGFAMEGHKRFTGAMVGVYGYNGGKGTVEYADFDWFRYRASV
ncbi:MAG: glycoside hydrolase family 43 protein [Spirochaetales bacterium]|nr:glycoside hydrolase family 43 protein [Spirochaetales bacterium]